MGGTPFAEAWAPSLADALSQCTEALGPGHPALALWPGMAQHLEARCLALGGQVLLRAFRRHQAQVDPAAWLLGPPAPGDAQHRAFMRAWAQGGREACMKAYPLLGAGLERLAAQAAEAFVAWARAMAADAEALGALGLVPQPWAWPSAARFGCSDPHSGGRSVAILIWPDGRRLVHKPRDGALEAAWQGLLAWVRAQDPRWDLPSLPCLSRGGRLWMAFAAQEACADAEAVARFHGRVGALMALLHLLYGNDCHHENLIAMGEWPVVVDAETFLLPDFRFHPEARPSHPAWATWHDLAHGVRLSGLLPPTGESQGPAAAPACEGLLPAPDGARHPTWRWLDANTDRVRFVAIDAPLPARGNLPMWGGLPQGPQAHLPALQAGFVGRSAWLAAHAEALMAPQGPLAAFRGALGRFVFRPSYVYAQLLLELCRPESLADEAAREGVLAALDHGLAALPVEAQEAAQALVAAEKVALRRGDVPWFGVRTDGDALLAEGEALPGWLRPGFSRMAARLSSLDEVAIDAQVGLLRVALGAPEPPDLPWFARRQRLPWEARAQALVSHLKGRAVRALDGGVSWAFPKRGQASRQHLPQGPGLYHGRLGTAIALAAWAALAEDPTARDLARRATEAAWRDGVPAGAWGLGEGLGGWLYGLVVVGRFLGEGAWAERAWATAEALPSGAVAIGDALDVVSGVAGLVLGLAALPERGPRAQATLEAAVAQLLAGQGPEGGWSESGTPQGHLGFAHGAAGQGWALAKAVPHLPPPLGQAACAAAQRAWAWESAQALPEGWGWPDGRAGSTGQAVQAWCHGAAGVGLARAGALALGDRLGARPDRRVAWAEDLRLAVAALGQAPPTGGDALCCGEAGRVELLLAAGLRAEAEARGEALAWAPEADGWRHVSPSGAFCPSLFQGAAGVAYTCLRLAHPGALPQLLLLEA